MTKPSLKHELAKAGDGLLCPIALFVKDGKVLTGNRHYKEASVWTIPGGRSEVGETMEQTLRREVTEEVGITEFEIIDFIGEMPGSHPGDTVLLFYCTTPEEATLMEPEKFSEWRWVSINDWAADEAYMGFNPAVRDMITQYLLSL